MLRTISRRLDIFETILNSAPDGLIVVNEKGTILMVNYQLKKLFGYEETELIGKEIELLIPEDYATKHWLLRQEYNAAPKQREMGCGGSFPARRKDGTEFYAEISLSAARIDSELFISAAVRDVTDKTKLTRQLQEHELKISEQNSRLMNFAHVVSHNLRSYGTNIATLLSFLTEATDDSERVSMMEHLNRVSLSLNETIDNLTKVVAIHTNGNQEREKLNLQAYVDKTIEILSGDIRKHNAVVTNLIPSNLYVNLIPAYLESILLNLLTNSLKYKDPHRNPIVNLTCRSGNDNVVLQISDNGLGIDLKKFGHKLFNMHATFHGNSDARGIGLFITKNQVEALGGRIDVESEPGRGTTFRVFFS